MSLYLLDTNVLIYFMQDTPEVKSFFYERITLESTIYYSFITRLELIGLPKISNDTAEKIDMLLNEFYRIDYNLNIEEHVLKIRKNKRLKIPDAIIAASAIYKKSILVTRNEKDFKGIPNLKVLNPFSE